MIVSSNLSLQDVGHEFTVAQGRPLIADGGAARDLRGKGTTWWETRREKSRGCKMGAATGARLAPPMATTQDRRRFNAPEGSESLSYAVPSTSKLPLLDSAQSRADGRRADQVRSICACSRG